MLSFHSNSRGGSSRSFLGGAEGSSPLSQAGEVLVKVPFSQGEFWKVKRAGLRRLSTHPTCSLLLAASRGSEQAWQAHGQRSVHAGPARAGGVRGVPGARTTLSSAGLTAGRSCREFRGRRERKKKGGEVETSVGRACARAKKREEKRKEKKGRRRGEVGRTGPKKEEERKRKKGKWKGRKKKRRKREEGNKIKIKVK